MTVDVRSIEGAIVRPELVPDYIVKNIGEEGADAFERYWRECCRDPEKMRVHRERVTDLRRRRDQKGGST